MRRRFVQRSVIFAALVAATAAIALAADVPKPAAGGAQPAQGQALPQEQAAIDKRLADLQTMFARRGEVVKQESAQRAQLAAVDRQLSSAQAELSVVESQIASAKGDKKKRADTSGLQRRAGQLGAAIAQLTAQRIPLVQAIEALDKELAALEIEWWDLTDPRQAFTRNEQQAAIAPLTEWIAVEPGNVAARLSRGFAYWRVGRFEQALVDFNAATDLPDPPPATPYVARAGLACSMGDDHAGMADFNHVLGLNVREPLLFLFRGWSHAAAGKYASAIDDFGRAAKFDRKDDEILRSWAIIEAACPVARLRNGQKAVEHARQACELTEWKQWPPIAALAAAYAETGNFDEAVKQIARAAGMTFGENRDECLAEQKKYENHEPLRLTGSEFLGLGTTGLPVGRPAVVLDPDGRPEPPPKPVAPFAVKRNPNDLLKPTADSKSWRIDLDQAASGVASVLHNAIVFEVLRPTGSDLHLQAVQPDRDLKEGYEHTVRFQAKATDNRSVTLFAGSDLPGGHGLSLNEPLSLTTEYQPFEFKFRAHDVVKKKGCIGFALGAEKGDVFVKEMSLVESAAPVAGSKPAPTAKPIPVSRPVPTAKNLLKLRPGGASWRVDLNSGAEGLASLAGDTVIFSVQQPTGTDWHIQALRPGLDLKEGQEYTVRFQARASQNRKVTLFANIDMPDWHGIGLNEELSLTTDYQPFEFKFRASNVLPKSNRIGFALAAEKGDVMVKEMSLVEHE